MFMRGEGGGALLARGAESAALVGNIAAVEQLRPFLGEGLADSSVIRETVASVVDVVRSRSFNQMVGFTDDVIGKVRSIISTGVLEGTGVSSIKRQMVSELDWLSRWRAEKIVRTEINYARNQAYLARSDELRIGGKKPRYVWSSLTDSVARESHKRRSGRIFTQAQVQQLIGEPNCRCSISAISPNDDRYGNVVKSIISFVS